MSKYPYFNIEDLTDKNLARIIIAECENEVDIRTHDLKVYLAYKEYEAVIRIAEILNDFKKIIKDIKKKFRL